MVSWSSEEVVLSAPLAPNLNHRGTAFGGSVATLGILAGWTHVHFRLRSEGIETHTVIHESSVHYDRPVAADMLARSRDISEADWARFTKTLLKRGKARIRVHGAFESEGEAVGSFTGSYVALLA